MLEFLCSAAILFKILHTINNDIVDFPSGPLPVSPLTQRIALEDSDDPCTICINKIKSGETFVKLSCNHTFHYNCLAQWSTHSRLCPLCKHSFESEQ